MGEVHQLLTERGKARVLAECDIDRKVVEAAAGYLGNEDGETGLLYSGWAQSGLPHKRLPDDASWQVHTEHMSLVVQPGLRPSLSGNAIPVGVPYGSRARLICIYLQTEALRTQSREVELGKSLHAWLRRMEISIGGKSMQAVRDQAERISRCRMTFQIKQGGRVGLLNQNLLDTAMFVEEDDAQGRLFLETARLSEVFFEQLKRHPLPIEERAVKEIANNSMAIDVYCWLAYRLHALEQPRLVTWKALAAQFGRGIKGLAHFKWYFAQTLELALAVYQDALVTTDERGVTLHPSRPPVAAQLSRRLRG
jgi:hypothetical protein